MKKEQPIEFFTPPNTLKAKVGSAIGGIDVNAIKRAEEAIEALKSEFGTWINDDVNRLVAMRDAHREAPGEETHGDFYRAAHDLKGQGETFEFPLVSRIAASLCHLLDGTAPGVALPHRLVDAHVDAIRVAVRDQVKDASTRVATALAIELEMQVSEFLGRLAPA